MFKSFNTYFENLSPKQCLQTTLLASLLLGVLDALIGSEISVSVFYTVPIMLATWYGGKLTGLILAIVSAVIWLVADMAPHIVYTSNLIPIWNTLARLSFFIIIWRLLLIVHEKLLLEESLADTDHLTGLSNRRFFLEQLEREKLRAQRHPQPFTVTYLDLDNFKYVNDSMGHDVGDELLQLVANKLQSAIRETDYAARLGGDEFAVLFPMLDEAAAKAVVKKLQSDLLDAMTEKNWPVTFSIGVVTFRENMNTSRDMVKMVDDLMYEVKKAGKNNIRHLVWPAKSL